MAPKRTAAKKTAPAASKTALAMSKRTLAASKTALAASKTAPASANKNRPPPTAIEIATKKALIPKKEYIELTPIEEARAIAEFNGGRLLSTAVAGPKHKLTWKCADAHRWESALAPVLNGTWCPTCAVGMIFNPSVPEKSYEKAFAGPDTLLDGSKKRITDNPGGLEIRFISGADFVCPNEHIWPCKADYLRKQAYIRHTKKPGWKDPWCPVCRTADPGREKFSERLVGLIGITAVVVNIIVDYIEFGQLVTYNIQGDSSMPNLLVGAVWVSKNADCWPILNAIAANKLFENGGRSLAPGYPIPTFLKSVMKTETLPDLAVSKSNSVLDLIRTAPEFISNGDNSPLITFVAEMMKAFNVPKCVLCIRNSHPFNVQESWFGEEADIASVPKDGKVGGHQSMGLRCNHLSIALLPGGLFMYTWA